MKKPLLLSLHTFFWMKKLKIFFFNFYQILEFSLLEGRNQSQQQKKQLERKN